MLNKMLQVADYTGLIKCIQVPTELDNIKLNDNQFLAQIFYSPINPLDIARMNGKMGDKLPFTPGSEASGRILKVGASLSQDIINQYACFRVPDGAWRSYAISDIDNCIILPNLQQVKNQEELQRKLAQSSCGFVNPLTSLGLFKLAEDHWNKHKIAQDDRAVIATGSTSEVAKMLCRLCLDQKIKFINVMRGDQKRVGELLDQFGNNSLVYGVSSDSQDFDAQLKQLCALIKPRVCFDCVGGILTGKIFNDMPEKSTVIVYGSIGSPTIDGINGMQVRWAEKTLQGFFLYKYLSYLTPEELNIFKQKVVENKDNCFTTQIKSIFKFEDIQSAIVSQLAGNNMAGKIILQP